MEFAKPNENHEWLHSFIGRWTFEAPGPDGKSHPGEEVIEPMGDLWIKITQTGNVPDMGKIENIILLGYDVTKEKFVGTFVSSMMSRLWVYEGTLSDDKKTLTLASEGPSMKEGEEDKLVTYHDIVEKISDQEYNFRSELQDEAGNWVPMMEMPHKRA